MLIELTIKDIVLIHYVHAQFDNGLNVITGETGAGKSLLLDALGLIAGARGDGSLVRSGQSQGYISAVFSVAPTHPCRHYLDSHNITHYANEDIILRRVQYADGKSRAYVNDAPISINTLKHIASFLIEIHGQHDTRLLADVTTHRLMLDHFGGLKAQLNTLKNNWNDWKDAKHALNTHKAFLQTGQQELDLLDKTLQELDILKPEKGEETILDDKRRLMMNVEKIKHAIDESLQHLHTNSTITSQLSQAEKHLYRFSDDHENIKKALENIERAHIEIEEATHHLQSMIHSLNFDEEELSTIEERLFTLRSLARKHAITVDELPDLHKDITEKTTLLDEGEFILKQRIKKEEETRNIYYSHALALRKKRYETIEKLNHNVNTTLQPLKLHNAFFEAKLEELDLKDSHIYGIDTICFYASLNPGSPTQPIQKIASGGEMSRITLALRSIMYHHDCPPTMIFDEIDTGVGGAVAEAVGKKLRQLGNHGQVISITHSPQVAAQAKKHFYIEKNFDNNTEPTMAITNLQDLSLSMREEEISRMLSGETITQEARAAARKLIAQANLP